MMYYGYGGWTWWQAAVMWIGMIAFWVLIIWSIYFFIARSRAATSSPDAKQILDDRLAHGEINLDQYREIRETLEGRRR